MHAETAGKDKPLYFASADEMIAEMRVFQKGANYKSSTSSMVKAVEESSV